MPTVPGTRTPAIPSVRASTVIATARSATTSDEALVDGGVGGIAQPPARGRSRRTTEKNACKSGDPEEVGGAEVGAEEIEPAVDDTAEDPEFVHQPKRQKRTPQKRKPKATPSGEPPAKKKPPSRRKHLAIESSDSGSVPATGAADTDVPSAPQSARKKVHPPAEPRAPKGIGKPRGRRRAESPEDGETQEIAVNVVKMKDLCRDMRIGKKSKRFFELQQMDSTKLAKEQEENVERERRIAAGEAEGGEHETTEERLERLANERGKRT